MRQRDERRTKLSGFATALPAQTKLSWSSDSPEQMALARGNRPAADVIHINPPISR